MSYNFEQIEQWKKEGKKWEWIAQKYNRKLLTVQRWYFRKKNEAKVLNAGESEPEEIETIKKDMSFFRFIYKELTGKHSRYDSLPVLQLKIANILIELAKTNGN